MASKQVLREVYLAKRLTLTNDEWTRRSALIVKQLIELIKDHQFKYIHTFLPIVSKKELNTHLLINQFTGQNGVKFVIPKMEKGGRLSHFLCNDKCSIQTNKWGVPEPVTGEKADLDKIDLVIVPMVIGDKENNRIGYGKGFYDRFLPLVPKAYILGVSLLPLLDHIPFVEEMDYRLTDIIYPHPHL